MRPAPTNAVRLLAGAVLLAAGLGLAGPAAAQAPEATEDDMPGSILVHITHGPEHPTRAALGFSVARGALEQGHEVTVFLAGDGVQLMRDGVLNSLEGLGTGNLREAYDALVAGGVRFYLSGGSSAARGLTDEQLEGKPVEMAGPPVLARLSLEHDRMFTY